VDHNRDAFLNNLPSFVEQIDDVDHINLFLTNLGCVPLILNSGSAPNVRYRRSSQPPELIAQLCDALRLELEARDLTKYVNCILTAYVVKKPPDHEAGLALLLRLRGE
jgi:elongator complex protein 1